LVVLKESLEKIKELDRVQYHPPADQKKVEAVDLITKEEKNSGSISIMDYANMLSFSYGTCGFIMFFLSGTTGAIV